ncbi:MAG: hypothetical protein EOM52_09510 [Clostridia bacterium]|nr:hypothetical protein [Clostridia bacterium]
MASRQTEHYGLNQWEERDSFLRAEFNEDNRKIDAALAGKADKGEVDTAMARKCELVASSYMGNGSYPREISVGFQPRAVLLTSMNGIMNGNGSIFGGLFGPGFPLRTQPSGGDTAAEIITTGFRLTSYSGNYTNANGNIYHYMAFR